MTGLTGIALVAVVSFAVTPSPTSVTAQPSSPIVRSQVGGVTGSATASSSVVYVEVPAQVVTNEDGATTASTQVIGQVTLVWLIDDDPARTMRAQYRLALDAPERDDEVTVWGDEPVVMAFDDVDETALEPGTMITDADGALVAVCDEVGEPRAVDASADEQDEAVPGVSGSGATSATD